MKSGIKAYDSLNWKEGPSLVDFNEANSKIDIPSNFSILEKEDAHQWLYWLMELVLIN